MKLRIEGDTIGELWLTLLQRLYADGTPVAPRKIGCREFLGVTLHMSDARNNIFVNKERDLNYRFMVAEWLWIVFGHNDLETIAHYNSQIRRTSDDGKTLWGAYGPPVRDHWSGVFETLRNDPDSRQAVIIIYQQPVRPTLDVPCTLTAQFLIRGARLHTIVSMRSSDIWLGIPYDVFTFTMLANILAAQLHVILGSFTIHLGSSHLYDSDRERTEAVLVNPEIEDVRSPALIIEPPNWVDTVLTSHSFKDGCVNRQLTAEGPLVPCGGKVDKYDENDHRIVCSKCGDRYVIYDDPADIWLGYARALLCNTRKEALAFVKGLAAL